MVEDPSGTSDGRAALDTFDCNARPEGEKMATAQQTRGSLQPSISEYSHSWLPRDLEDERRRNATARRYRSVSSFSRSLFLSPFCICVWESVCVCVCVCHSFSLCISALLEVDCEWDSCAAPSADSLFFPRFGFQSELLLLCLSLFALHLSLLMAAETAQPQSPSFSLSFSRV